MPKTARLFAVIAILGLAACSDSDTDTSTDTTPATTAMTASTDATKDTVGETTADTVADTVNDTVVNTVAAPTGPDPILTDGTAPAERTIAISDNGFTPDTLTIKTGEIVTFVADGDGIFAVLVGPLDGATVTGGLTETFVFPGAGTYTVVEDISGNTATITVED